MKLSKWENNPLNLGLRKTEVKIDFYSWHVNVEERHFVIGFFFGSTFDIFVERIDVIEKYAGMEIICCIVFSKFSEIVYNSKFSPYKLMQTRFQNIQKIPKQHRQQIRELKRII